ncbi:MAG: ABC transporter ATP-binding protein [Hyphomicrobiaceae bacterium]
MLKQPTSVDVVKRTDAERDIVAMSAVRFTWPGRKGFTIEIDAFTMERGEKLLLIGPSGSGKSTFLSLLAGINVPSSGHLSILGTEIARLPHSARDHFRSAHMGIIFQMFNLLPYGSVIDNVVLPLHFAPERRQRVLSSGTLEAEARRLLAALGLREDDYEHAAASSLSVGQQQRVACARALIGRPELIIADEPTSALDRNTQVAFLDLLFAEVAAAGASLLMVSHDETLASRFDRAVRLDEIATTQRTKGAA